MRVKPTVIRSLAFGLSLIAGSAMGGPSEGKMMAYWEAQIQQQPDNPVHYIRRANGHAELGEWDEAFSDIERVEQLGEPLSAALARGDYYQRLGQQEQALAQFNKVLSANPKQVRALILRARLQVERGEAMLALRDYQQLFRVYPDADTGHYRQAANLCVQQGQPGKALALLDERMQATGPIRNCKAWPSISTNSSVISIQRLSACSPCTSAVKPRPTGMWSWRSYSNRPDTMTKPNGT